MLPAHHCKNSVATEAKRPREANCASLLRRCRHDDDVRAADRPGGRPLNGPRSDPSASHRVAAQFDRDGPTASRRPSLGGSGAELLTDRRGRALEHGRRGVADGSDAPPPAVGPSTTAGSTVEKVLARPRTGVRGPDSLGDPHRLHLHRRAPGVTGCQLNQVLFVALQAARAPERVVASPTPEEQRGAHDYAQHDNLAPAPHRLLPVRRRPEYQAVTDPRVRKAPTNRSRASFADGSRDHEVTGSRMRRRGLGPAPGGGSGSVPSAS